MTREELYKLAVEAIARVSQADLGYNNSLASWCQCLAKAAVDWDESEVMDLLKEIERPEEQASA